MSSILNLSAMSPNDKRVCEGACRLAVVVFEGITHFYDKRDKALSSANTAACNLGEAKRNRKHAVIRGCNNHFFKIAL